MSTEQYMHFKKAETFDDKDTGCLILNASSPTEHKRLGRRVRHFCPKLWTARSTGIVRRANFLKFSQNDQLRKRLISTYPKRFVEASPYDRKWGIGLSLNDSAIHNSALWRGENLLGRILTSVREELMEERKKSLPQSKA